MFEHLTLEEYTVEIPILDAQNLLKLSEIGFLRSAFCMPLKNQTKWQLRTRLKVQFENHLIGSTVHHSKIGLVKYLNPHSNINLYFCPWPKMLSVFQLILFVKCNWTWNNIWKKCVNNFKVLCGVCWEVLTRSIVAPWRILS